MAKPKIYKLLVANGALLQSPIFEPHARGRNWMAVIDVDATMPGGLSRRFMNRGRGECLYDIEQLALFDPIEFGADYTTSVGTKRPLRWHGIVTAKTEGYIHVEECKTGATAVIRSKEARTSKADRLNALKAEREAFLAKAEALQRELEDLEKPEEASPANA